MAVLRTKDARKLSPTERNQRLKDLKFELSKANVTANRTNAKTKEIKKAIARILTVRKENSNAPTKNGKGEKKTN